MFRCTNKKVNKLLSFYRFRKVKTLASLDLKTLIQSQQNTLLKVFHRTDVSKKNINHMRISSVNFKTSNYYNKPKI